MRSLFISDVHLGTPFCEHEKLLTFLKSLENKETGNYDLKYLYLVGDIVDLMDCNIPLLFTKHRSIIKKIFRMSDRGVKVIYIPGNHDHFFRHEHNSSFQNGFIITNKIIHKTQTGKSWLIIHGDEFDTAIQLIPFAYTLGDLGYKTLYRLSRWFGWIWKYFKNDDFSLAYYVKIKVKNMGFDDSYVFDIGSRDYLHKLNKLDEESIAENAKELLKQ